MRKSFEKSALSGSYAAKMPPIPAGMIEKNIVDLEAARKQVTWPISLPAYLPAGTVLKGVIVDPGDGPEFGGAISLMYTNGVEVRMTPETVATDYGKRIADSNATPDSWKRPDVRGVIHRSEKGMVKGSPALVREGGSEGVDGTDGTSGGFVQWSEKAPGTDVDLIGRPINYMGYEVYALRQNLAEALKIAESIK